MFESMIKVVPEGQKGIAQIKHIEVNRDAALMSFIRRENVREGRYAQLFVGNSLMMSDTDMEHRTNWTACNKARGKVMIAGLGLGMILTAILKKPEVESVLVVEKYQDVIDLVSPHFNSPKLSIICADILDWKPAKGMKFDAIYFDIWPDICTDNLKQINLLHHRFKYFLNRENPSCWMGSWCQELLRAKKRQERNHSWY